MGYFMAKNTFVVEVTFNERISKWAHLSFYHKWFSRYLHLKFEKEVTF